MNPQERADIQAAIEAIQPRRSIACICDYLFHHFNGRWDEYDTNFIKMKMMVREVKNGGKDA